jgi:hypothetical protein
MGGAAVRPEDGAASGWSERYAQRFAAGGGGGRCQGRFAALGSCQQEVKRCLVAASSLSLKPKARWHNHAPPQITAPEHQAVFVESQPGGAATSKQHVGDCFVVMHLAGTYRYAFGLEGEGISVRLGQAREPVRGERCLAVEIQARVRTRPIAGKNSLNVCFRRLTGAGVRRGRGLGSRAADESAKTGCP